MPYEKCPHVSGGRATFYVLETAAGAAEQGSIERQILQF